MITFRPATADDAIFISRGFHTAMLMDDTPEERIRLFADKICSRSDVLYSHTNTIIAEREGEAVGMVTAYDGSKYSGMRKVTMALVKEHLGIEFPGMEDEALPGEYYIDSLAVMPEHRLQGIGRMLLTEATKAGHEKGLIVTLAVDPVNTKAQQLYESFGFVRDTDIFIFGHTYWKMKNTSCTAL